MIGIRRALVVSCTALALAAPIVEAAGRPRSPTDKPAVSVAGAPRSLLSFVVPMPAEFEADDDVHFTVERSGAVDLIGRLEGTLAGRGLRRQLMLTLRVPADARVGLLDVADVVFRTSDGRSIVVPLILRVPAVRALQLEAPPTLAQLREGDRVELNFVLRNSGNTFERVVIDLTAPNGWPIRSDARAIVDVAPFEVKDLLVRVVVPVGANPGESSVRAVLRETNSSDSTTLSTAFGRVQVAERTVDVRGLRVNPFIAIAGSREGSAMTSGVALSGQIAPATELTVQVQPRATSAGGVQGLAALGVIRPPFQARLTSPRWDADVGAVGRVLPAIAGQYASGEGATIAFRGDKASYSALLVRPARATQVGGHSVAAKASWQTDLGTIGATLTSMREDRGSLSRDLTAIGAEWTSVAPGPWTIGLGTALRSYSGSGGLGASADIARETTSDRLNLRASYAPGGQSAFAFGTTNLAVDYRRSISYKLSADASASYTADESALSGDVSQNSAALGAAYQLTDATSISLRGRQTQFERRGDATGFGALGNSEQAGEISVSSSVGTWNFGGSARLSLLGRSTGLLGGRTDVQRVPQQGIDANVSKMIGDLGQLTFGASQVRTAAGSGVPTQNNYLYLSGSTTPLMMGANILSMNARVSAQQTQGRPSVLNGQIGAAAQLLGGYVVEAALIRNGFFANSSVGGLWTAAVKVSVDTRFGLPSVFTKVAGVVYNDRNGNGRREEGEPGIPHVEIEVNRLRIRTDEDGQYRLPPNVRGRLRIDSSRLPAGFVLGGQAQGRTIERGDIPLRQTGSLQVELRLAENREGIRPRVSLDRVDVVVIGEDGLEWIGRHTEAGVVVFDALPAGRYTFRLDAARAEEPVRLEEGVLAEVAATTMRAVTLTLRGRDVRLIDPSPAGSRGGTGRGGSGGRSNRLQQR